jgi:hypothetical protein
MAASSAFEEVSSVLAGISLAEVDERRAMRQAEATEKSQRTHVGVQKGLNQILRERLGACSPPWRSEVPVFPPDPGSGKGFWTMDFHKRFPRLRNGVGIEVTFNHAEALPWTLIRPTLAYQSESVVKGSRIDVAGVIIGTDQLKGGRPRLRMDSAVGTYERLRTLLPKMKWVLPGPMVIFGLDWAEGGQTGDVDEIDLYALDSGLPKPDPIMVELHDFGPRSSS